jgi:hypothetical protein
MSWARTSAQDVRKLASAIACAVCAAAHPVQFATAAVPELTAYAFLLPLADKILSKFGEGEPATSAALRQR